MNLKAKDSRKAFVQVFCRFFIYESWLVANLVHQISTVYQVIMEDIGTAYSRKWCVKSSCKSRVIPFGWRLLGMVDSTMFFVSPPHPIPPPPKTFPAQLVNYTVLRDLKASNCELLRKKRIGRTNCWWEEYQQRRDEVRHFIEYTIRVTITALKTLLFFQFFTSYLGDFR